MLAFLALIWTPFSIVLGMVSTFLRLAILQVEHTAAGLLSPADWLKIGALFLLKLAMFGFAFTLLFRWKGDIHPGWAGFGFGLTGAALSGLVDIWRQWAAAPPITTTK